MQLIQTMKCTEEIEIINTTNKYSIFKGQFIAHEKLEFQHVIE